MSSKEIKAALKAAKNAIQIKDYQDALHHCNYVLKRDGSNYNALVFSGLCYSETDRTEEARESYSHAIKSQPDQILAYQGLANLFSKHWKGKKTKDELDGAIETYEKLLSMMGRKDMKKYIELCVTLCDSYIVAGSLDKAMNRLNMEFIALQEVDDVENKLNLHRTVVKVLDSNGANSDFRLKNSIMITKSFEKLLSQTSESAEYVMATLNKYVQFLQTDANLFVPNVSLLLDVCTSLHAKFPEKHLPMEIIIQAYIQQYDHPCMQEIDAICEKLKGMKGLFADVCVGSKKFQLKEYENAKKILEDKMPQCPNFLPGWVILCKALTNIHHYAETEKISRIALMQYKQILNGSISPWKVPIMSLDSVKYELSKYLASGLCGSQVEKNIVTGIETFKKLLLLHPEDLFLHINMVKGLVKLGRFDEASAAITQGLETEPENTEAEAWKAYILFKTGLVSESISDLQSMSPSPSSLYLLGKSMWEAGEEYRTEKKNCFTALVKAAKLDPYNGEIFLLLGHFYCKVQHDTVRAKGCYQKAYQLDAMCEDASSSLADVYVAEGDTASAIDLYESITKGAGPSGYKWAWLRLGLCKLKAKDITNAIQCFQSALRIDSEDAICWECLGEGYLQRGSYTAAWKAFDRAHQLSPNSVYSLYQMARVKQVQGMYPDAIKEYKDVLKLFPGYVPALQGLGESEFLFARQMFSVGRFQTGVEHSEKAIEHSTKACFLRSDLCCLWKLLGDCCVLIHSLDGSVAHMNIPTVLLGSAQKSDDDGITLVEVGKAELLSLGSRLYCRAIHLQPENASLWHDLGMSYFRQTDERKSDEKDVELATKAVDAVKKSIVLEPTNHIFWCSLGVMAASDFINDPALAQHSFLKSISHDPNNVKAWSNLATLYLAHGHVKKAHEAFKVAQSLDPSFVNSWIGQALIAETIGSEETMDLFRHSTELGLHKQAAAGYSSWVTKVMSDTKNRYSVLFKDNIQNMNAVATAVTQMSKQCHRNPSWSWASTVNGFLLEYSGLNRSAEEAYKQALHATDAEVTEENQEKMKIQRNKVASNLARVLCKNGKYKESISVYQSISPLSDFHDVCGLALACYRSGQSVEAIEAYKQAGQLASADNEKAQVMVAMAMTFWKMDKLDEAKTLLYRCFQTSKSGLLALCALGIALKDQTLVGAAVGEIMKQKASKVEMDEKDMVNDCLLICAAAEICGDPKLAINEVQKAVHKIPFSSSLRVLLCRLLVTLNSSKGIRSTSLISKQSNRIFNDRHVSNPLDRDSDLWKGQIHHKEHVSVLQCSSLSTLAAGLEKSRRHKTSETLRKAQALAHMHPYEPSSWAYLSCACHAEDVEKWFSGSSSQYCQVVEMLTLHSLKLSLSDSAPKDDLETWASNISSWAKVLNKEEIGEKNDADSKFIHHLQKVSSAEDKTKLLKEVSSLLPATSNPQIYLKYFGQLLEQIGQFEISKQMFEKSIQLSKGNDPEKAAIYFQLLRLAFVQSTDPKTDKEKKKKWREVIRNVLTEALKLDSTSLNILLFQALSFRLEKNHRKSKSFLNRVINSTDYVTDDVRSMAIWYLYRALHERNDSSELEKLVSKATVLKDKHIERLQKLLPIT